MENKIPQATARRLPLYYRFITNLHHQGKTRVSSKELSDAVKVDSATIRRDFSYFGALGKKGYGYNVDYLLQFFKETLSEHKAVDVALIGVGNLGTALLNYNFSRNHNTRLAMAFDHSEKKAETFIGGVPIYHVDQLEEKISNVEVAILTVPAAAAQDVANRLVASGVKGILNFTPARLTIPDHVRIHHIDLSVELQSLVYFLKHYPV